jgi:hypothetical protein
MTKRTRSRTARRGGQNDPNVPDGSTGLSNEAPAPGLANTPQLPGYDPNAPPPSGQGRRRGSRKQSRKSRRISRRR